MELICHNKGATAPFNNKQKRVIKIEEKSEYISSSTIFAGPDTIPMINNISIPEMQKIKYVEYLEEKEAESSSNIQGHIDYIVFSDLKIRNAISLKPEEGNSFILIFKNEFGNQMKMTFINPVFKRIEAAIEPNFITLMERLYFSADSIVLT